MGECRPVDRRTGDPHYPAVAMPPADSEAPSRRSGGVGNTIVWFSVAWVVANLAWLWHYRRSRLFELDEAGYASTSVRLARQRTWDGVWGTLQEGVQGPMQALLAAPPQWIRGQDPGTLLWENVLLGAGAAVVAYLAAKRMADRPAGIVVAAIVLLSPGVLEYSRLALTVMPAVFFSTVAMAALIAGKGLERASWAALAGVAIGCMTLSRSMTIGFVPAMAVGAAGFAFARSTPVATVIRNGLLVAATALMVAAWWWVARWSDVSDYLFGGGSSDTGRVSADDKALLHVEELVRYLGVVVPLVAVVTVVPLFLWARRRTARAPVDATVPGADGTVQSSAADRLPTWPLWAAASVMWAAVTLSSATGLGFMLPTLPWVVVAAVVAIRRWLPAPAWRVWAVLVVLAGIVPAIVHPGPALAANLDYACDEGVAKSSCDVTDQTSGREWRETIARVADRVWTIRTVAPDAPVALLSRDLLLNGNTLGLATELRYRAGVDWYRFFQPGASHDEQLAELREEAGILVVAEDYRPDDVILYQHQPPPAEVLAAAIGAGFTMCEEIETPDGRRISVLVAEGVPTSGCA